ncbi:MAG: sn-glycerol-1-phosphate dehydrogenase, partial [Verrucomicrobia bacterium]|nr:sn-glycerol-1-phosphate dehydrogenase [Verrucomicrobiota bacterium]
MGTSYTPEKVPLAEALIAGGETRSLELGQGVLGRTPEVFRQHFGDKPALPVADTNTFAVAGQAVVEAFRRAGQPCREPFVFTDPQLYAEHKYVAALEAALQENDAIPVAVGSGTINDLTKLAAHRAGRRYLTVGTAASMDGYTAFGASITYQGSKQTFSCPAPLAVVADLDVICAAPEGMNASGYADLLAKTAAGADWLVADALGVEAIDRKAWNIVQGGLREAVADPAGVRSGSREATRRLTEGLMLSGLSMQWTKTSRPASGAEHQFSHLWDMQHHVHKGQTPAHGFKVGIGTLAVTALYEYLLGQKLEDPDVEDCCARWPDDAAREASVRALFSQADLTRVALQESQAKWVEAAGLRRQLTLLRTVWPVLKARLIQQLIPFQELKAMLHTAGAPVEPEEIGISRARLRESFWQAYYLRRRFTALDLAARCG